MDSKKDGNSWDRKVQKELVNEIISAFLCWIVYMYNMS